MQRPPLFLTPYVLLLMFFATACAPSPSDDSPDAAGETASALAADIGSIVSDTPEATVAVSIRDPSTGLRFDRDADRLFHAASTMKVPVMIELYRRAARGDFDLADSLRVVNLFHSIVDGSEYALGDDPDEPIYETPGENMTIRDLLGNMITVSSNLATNLLIEFVSADSVQSTTESLGTTKMKTLRGVEDLKAYDAGLSNRTTSADLALLMERLMLGEAVGPDADRQMIDVLLGQHFANMIPAGLPDGVRAAHKTGSITRIHHDAAIVMPDGQEPYVLVILIEGVADRDESGALGATITELVHRRLRPTS